MNEPGKSTVFRMGRRMTNVPHASVTHAGLGGPGATPKPKLKVWIGFGARVKFGHGRAQLLQTIDALGSLRKAAAQLGMSYRSVWGTCVTWRPRRVSPSWSAALAGRDGVGRP